MNFIPKTLLKKLYTRGSLTKAGDGFTFNIKNRLMDVQLKRIEKLEMEGAELAKADVFADLGDGQWRSVDEINAQEGFHFKLGKSFNVKVNSRLNGQANLKLGFKLDTSPFGKLSFEVKDQVNEHKIERKTKIPRKSGNDYGAEAMAGRMDFIESFSGKRPGFLDKEPEDNSVYQGNIEHLTGFARVPLGIAGPIRVNGEFAKGDFLVPLATTEGTLVASYNKGIKLVNESGGVNCRVIGDSMQRAPVFIFDSLVQAADFSKWIKTVTADLKEQAELGSNHLKYESLEVYQAGNNVFLRFNFFTGDAAGQNMANKAAFQICQWVLESYKGIKHFFLESNMASDKKHSFINALNSRGKRVVAEITFKEKLLIQNFGVDAQQLQRHMGVANLGGMMAGVNNNGLHTANALAALFIALGQDVANLAESTAGFVYTEVTEAGDLYGSITLPSLIVGTVGGGTGLPTQRDCLEMLGCYGSGKAKKLAEIVAGVVLAGEISLAAAISSLDWVAAHEELGRNGIQRMAEVSIIIPTYNEELCIGAVLKSLEKLEPQPAEVIVVDGGSKDKTEEIVTAFPVRFLCSPKRGRAAQMHFGVLAASGDIICFLHADTFAETDLVQVVRDTLADKTVALAGFRSIMTGTCHQRVTSFHNRIKTYYAPLIYSPYRTLFKGLRLLFGDQLLFCRRAVYLSAGGFDTNMLIMEEADLCLKMNRLGRIQQIGKKVYSSDRRVAHWGVIKSNLIFITIASLWALGVPNKQLARFYTHVR